MNNLQKALELFVTDEAAALPLPAKDLFAADLDRLCISLQNIARWRGRIEAARSYLVNIIETCKMQAKDIGEHLVEIGPKPKHATDPSTTAEGSRIGALAFDDHYRPVPLDLIDLPEINPDGLFTMRIRVPKQIYPAGQSCEITLIAVAELSPVGDSQIIVAGTEAKLRIQLPDDLVQPWVEQLKSDTKPFFIAVSRAI